MFGNLPVAVPHVKTGRLRALAIDGVRAPLAKEVPTRRVGLRDIRTWYGMLAPAGSRRACTRFSAMRRA